MEQDWRSSAKKSNMNWPIFLYGTQRSGTNVFRLMLDSHKDINCAAGVEFIFDFLNHDPDTDKWTYDLEGLRDDWIFKNNNLDVLNSDDGMEIVSDFVDQLRRGGHGHLVLSVHQNLDKIAAIFPDAKIIHLFRDPRDTAKSCIGMGWAGNTYYGVNDWLKTESEWDHYVPTFPKGNVIDVSYERLISDPAGQLDAVCKLFGVPLMQDMFDYTNRTTYGLPDPSAIQRWRKSKAKRDIALVEVRTKDLLLARHYELSGYPLDPPGLLERIRLWWTNKLYKWKFGLERYGYLNFIMEKVTRKVKFARRLHRIFNERMYEIWKQNLKR
jgi:hypothetical protein